VATNIFPGNCPKRGGGWGKEGFFIKVVRGEGEGGNSRPEYMTVGEGPLPYPGGREEEKKGKSS